MTSEARKRDAIVARELFEWKNVPYGKALDWIPDYSKNIGHAMGALARMNKRGWYWELEQTPTELSRVNLYRETDHVVIRGQWSMDPLPAVIIFEICNALERSKREPHGSSRDETLRGGGGDSPGDERGPPEPPEGG